MRESADIGDLVESFAELQPDAPPLDAALLVNRLVVPDLETSALRSRIVALCEGQPLNVPAWDYLARCGYAMPVEEADAESASCLSWVLQHRSGLPITMAVLLCELTRHQGGAMCGVNYPGHFLCRSGDRFVDPAALELVDIDAWVERGATAAGQDADTFRRVALADADTITIALRMLNNVKYQWLAVGMLHEVLDALECQLAIVPDSFELGLQRAQTWRRLGAFNLAKDLVESLCQAELPQGAERLLEQELQALAGMEPDVLH